jgi:hypothetical protein
MAYVAVKAECGELAILVDTGGVAAGASVCELLLVPGGLLKVDPVSRLSVCTQNGLRVEQREFAVNLLVQESDAMPGCPGSSRLAAPSPPAPAGN